MLRVRTLLLLLVTYFSSFAQEPDLFHYYTVKDGLAQSSINAMAQDKNGFLWIGTDGGLCRFDGYNFKNYKRNSADPNAFNSDRGIHFYLDSKKRLWLISYNGISCYRDEKDNFLNLLTFEPKTSITTYNNFFGEDEQFIWAGLSDYGLLKINKQTLKLEKVAIPGITFKSEHTNSFNGFVEKGKVWIVNNGKLTIYDTKTNTAQQPPISVTLLFSLDEEKALGVSKGRAMLLDKKSLRPEVLSLTRNNKEFVSLAYKLVNHEVLFAVDSIGAVFYDTKAKKVVKTITTVNDGQSTRKLRFSSAYQDWSGNIWTQAYAEGLNMLVYPGKKFKRYRNPAPLTNAVYSITADENYVYAGVSRLGMSIFSKKDGRSTLIDYSKKNPILNKVGFIARSLNPDQIIVLGYEALTNKSTPFLYNKTSGKLVLFPSPVINMFRQYWPEGDFRKFVLKDNNHTLLSSIGPYLLSITQPNGKIKVDTIRKFEGELLSCAFRDRDQNLWIGTYKSLYVQKKGVWANVKLPKAMEIKTINQDLIGNIWLGHNDGIYILGQDYRIKDFYNEGNGLRNEHIYAILRADDGNMWFSHNKGLTVYKTKTKTFRHYQEDDGLQSTEFNSGAYFKAEDGEIFFGGINGVTSFYPALLKDNLHAPAVKITQISLFDRPYQTQRSAWNIRSLEFSYLENSLSFDFTMPEYTDPLKNSYRYQMEGLDKEWVAAGSRRFARYAALPPGDYIFKVKASNNDGIWSRETSIAITIIPPYWQQAWFQVLMAVITFVLFYILIITIQRIRSRRKRRIFELQQKVQLERERISRDLHDNVGTQLSLISKNIDGVLAPNDTLSISDRQRNLANISLTSKEVIATLRETIWALNKEEISFEEFSDKLKTYVHKQLKVHANMELQYLEADGAENLTLNPAAAINLFRICQEAVANAIKYANASKLEIRLEIFDGKFKITIKDNGQGFEQAMVDPLMNYGIENMKFRAAEMDCDFELDSVPNEFTKITIVKK
ncbi:MAG: triple tyrosine motif-containing protein [Pedobacter sp.]|nr:triple tyrosine motif-containing protein [Cellulomonas sp.]MDQ8052261.1 triple tyrosine motif-containing protein [Pedobacter sp.]